MPEAFTTSIPSGLLSIQQFERGMALLLQILKAKLSTLELWNTKITIKH
jgi:hypothetical protein